MNNWGNYTQSKIEKFNGNTIFMSYETPVVIIFDNKEVVRTKARFSRTTGKQISKFFRFYNIDKNNVKELSKDMFLDLLKKVKYVGSLGMLNSPYIK
jgi:hypothetical protein